LILRAKIISMFLMEGQHQRSVLQARSKLQQGYKHSLIKWIVK